MSSVSFRSAALDAARAAVCLAVLAQAGTALAADAGVDPGQRLRLTPQQRSEMWERMSPEQREAWRNARSQDERRRAWEGFSPEQRRDMWQRLTPEQREMMLRRLPPEQRRDMWHHMSPEQREAMRQRFVDQPPGPRARSGPPPHAPMYQLSPEERQRLRDQIRDAQRDVYRGPDRVEPGHRGRERGAGGSGR
jgi:hypothetical protein